MTQKTYEAWKKLVSCTNCKFENTKIISFPCRLCQFPQSVGDMFSLISGESHIGFVPKDIIKNHFFNCINETQFEVLWLRDTSKAMNDEFRQWKERQEKSNK